MKEIPKEALDILNYNPDTGEFTWKVQRGVRGKIGTRAGYLHPNGYRYIKVIDASYREHRLAFLLTGQEVPRYVDHINGIKDDNRWENLRGCSHSDNLKNIGVRSDSLSGIKNVIISGNKFHVVINVNGDSKFIGSYDDIELAELVAQEARAKYHGEFARCS